MAQFNILSTEGVNYVEIHLNNETVRTESGAMRYFQGNITMESKAPSLGGMFKAAFSGENVFRPTYTGTGKLVLEPSLYTFFELVLQGDSYILDRGAYLASENSVTVDAKINKALTGLASGEGLVQTQVSGQGKVIVSAPGPVQVIDLVNDRLVVDGTFAVARSSSLNFRLERSSKSLIGSVTSGEGVVNVLEGTGRVYLAPVPNKFVMLQSMISAMAVRTSG